MSMKNLARLAVVSVGLLGVSSALAGCGAEPVKEAAPPPINQNEATQDRIKGIQDSSNSKGASPGVDKAPDHTAPKAEEGGK